MTNKEICLESNSSSFALRKRRYLGRYFAHPMMQNRRAKRDDYKPSAVRVTQRYTALRALNRHTPLLCSHMTLRFV
ncbi:hypothetical protein [Piscirickettsia salmonis]|uniref:hypothetical protein n=1 Tax=Piscirickettsia salmonis TaxID=1238 RepID=UPI000332C6FE|nr:hypothetical protein [Piscirickettsia salmonis]ERL60449.1 hypothetical protein K661_03230 [Piscirickettsia salmonis LF-89 = ATCC VR-1361]